MPPKLLLGTNNKGKLREYHALLEGVPFELVSPADIGFSADVAETGKTFKENAGLKASVFMQKSGLITLADDSGLEVDALQGEPGVMSARYAGENATDMERIRFLLSKIKDIPWEKRTAQFRAVIAIAVPGEEIRFAEGECLGYITFEPRGEKGFGYDPVFFVPELGKTMAELNPAIKNRISHRGKAALQAREILLQI
ncbi:MAG TPA: XTP/dITP diphosphatase [Dehalococcoidales bacterium]|nr:XTP/dITP diphosphatase [Dehalococcoidales bacterium]